MPAFRSNAINELELWLFLNWIDSFYTQTPPASNIMDPWLRNYVDTSDKPVVSKDIKDAMGLRSRACEFEISF